MADILRGKYPERRGIVDGGNEGEGYERGWEFPSNIRYDGGKVVRVTGREYTSWERTVVDTVEGLKHLLTFKTTHE